MALLHINVPSKLKEELLNAEMNISQYLRSLIENDIKGDKKIINALKEQLQNEQKQKNIIEEIKLIGAIENIMQRIKQMSKLNNITYTLLLKKNLELLELEMLKEYYSQSTKDFIKIAYSKLKKNVYGIQ